MEREDRAALGRPFGQKDPFERGRTKRAHPSRVQPRRGDRHAQVGI
jgi:hypothetical protein